MRGSIPACVNKDYSFLSFIGCIEGEAEGASPFRSPLCGVVPECELRGADDGAGQRKDRDDLFTLRQGAGRTGGQHGRLPYLRDDYELPITISENTSPNLDCLPEETQEETTRAAILVAALARSLCPVFVVFFGRFFCSSFSASPSSPVQPRNSPFPPARKGTDCPGCRTRLYEAPSPGGLAYTPDNQWLVANGKKGKE